MRIQQFFLLMAAVITILGGAGANEIGQPLTTDPDINDDGIVNVVDLGLLKNCFGLDTVSAPLCLPSDFNGDGVVNVTDLGIMRSFFFEPFPTAAEAASLYQPVRRFPAPGPSQLRQLAVGDFNADGYQDVASTLGESGATEVYIYLGASDGFLSFAGVRGIGSDSRDIAVADFDADGFDDVVIANTLSGTMSVLFGDEAGDLARKVDIPIPASALGPETVAIGDFNGDGLVDMVVANTFQGSIRIVLANAQGSFDVLAAYVAFDGLADRVSSLAVADIDADGSLDIAASGSTGSGGDDNVAIFIGDGSGEFELASTIPQSAQFTEMSLADLDGDGAVDLLGIAGSRLFVTLQNIDGTFQPLAIYDNDNSTQFSFLESLSVSDVDGDEIPDVLVGPLITTAGRGALLWRGSGDGQFTQGPLVPIRRNQFSQLADMNGDSRLDIVSATSEGVSVVLSADTGGFLLDEIFSDNAAESLAVGDLNADGYTDIVAVDKLAFDSPPITALLGLGDGTFLPPNVVEVDIGSPDIDAEAVALGDLNGDGFLDIAVSTFFSSVYFYLGDGEGGFSGRNLILSTGARSKSIELNDLDSDGDLDIVVGNRNADIGIVLNNGDATFQSPTFVPAGDGPGKVIAEDVNGDDITDLIAANVNSADVSVLLGQGDAQFMAPAFYSVGEMPEALAIADFNEDGLPDIVTANTESDSLSFLFAAPNGGFCDQVSLPVGEISGGGLATADANSDGHSDLLIGLTPDRGIGLMLGNGDGSFQPMVEFSIGSDSPVRVLDALATGDFDGDQKIDIIAASTINASNFFTILLQRP